MGVETKEENKMDKKLVGIRELANMLAIDRSYVYWMVLHDSIPFEKVGKRTMFDVEKIQKWTEETKGWDKQFWK